MKRRTIVTATFVAGLYYLLVFLLPPRIGGSADADGASGATLVHRPGSAQETVIYTGTRTDRFPVLLEAPIKGTGPKRLLLAPAFNRPDDYRGAMNPQFVAPNRLYYIGLGWDDRIPRVCMAQLSGDRIRPSARAVLSNGKAGEPDVSGITWASVVRTESGANPWRMWYVGRLGDASTLCMAESTDGLRWRKRGPVTAPELANDTILSVNARATADGFELWLLIEHADGRRSLVLSALHEDGLRFRGRPYSVALVLPDGTHLDDLRLSETGTILYGSLQKQSEAPRIGMFRAAPRSVSARRLDIVEPNLIVPGARPRSTLLYDVRDQIDNILVVIGAFAVGLGLIGLAQVHGKRVLRAQSGWPESVTFFVAAVAMASFAVYARTQPDAKNWGSQGYHLLFYGLLQPLGASMFSLLAAYLVSASYRAFRIRSFEGGLLAGSALLIMLGQVPVGNWLTANLPPYLQIPRIMAWALFVNNTAVVRAVNFGIFVGALATALRVWLSMDRASMRSID